MTQRFGPLPAELLTHLIAQGSDAAVVQIGGQFELFVVGGSLDFFDLFADVAGVFAGDFELLDHGVGQALVAQFCGQCFT